MTLNNSNIARHLSLCLNSNNMNPDQNQYSIDYLNQIAPTPKKPGINNTLFLSIVGGGIVLALIVGALMLSKGAAGPVQKMERLTARLTTLQAISTKAQTKLKSNSLRATNSSMTLLLTNVNRDITAPLKLNGVDTSNLDKTIVASEDGSALTQKLEDARLNAIYDQTYAREMAYQLETVTALLKEIYTSTNSASLKTFLNTTNNNLLPITKQFSDFNDTNN